MIIATQSMRFAARLLFTLGQVLDIAKATVDIESPEAIDLELAAAYANRASLQLSARFGTGIEPNASEVLRNERAEIADSIRKLHGSGLHPSADTLALFLEQVEEHLQRCELAFDERAAIVLERELRALVGGAP